MSDEKWFDTPLGPMRDTTAVEQRAINQLMEEEPLELGEPDSLKGTLVDQIASLKHEVEMLTNAGVVECMARNKAVFERIEQLERELAAAKADRNMYDSAHKREAAAHLKTLTDLAAVTAERDALREFAAGRCVIQKVIAELGPHTLMPVASVDALKAERDALKEDAERIRIGLGFVLDPQVINSDNIGDIRRSLFLPINCQWNDIVREETAARENKPPRHPDDVQAAIDAARGKE